ncbi:MAG: nucleotidyltransferase domain-containing protein [Firmicutes bacterium]|nr:nucleotidyltransferase domain-containing protein [Bacillota bacterium]
MNNLIYIDLNETERLIKPALEKHPEIVAAYFFGSSLGLCRIDSDIDIGVILNSKVHMTEKEQDLLIERILSETPQSGNHLIDISILRESDAFFTHRVIRKGSLFFVSDAEELTDFIEVVSNKYRENYPRYRKALELIAAEV